MELGEVTERRVRMGGALIRKETVFWEGGLAAGEKLRQVRPSLPEAHRRRVCSGANTRPGTGFRVCSVERALW